MINRLTSHVRVLYIEDNPQLRSILTTGLTCHGFDVVAASDGAEAILQFTANHTSFDCIVTDHHLPDGSGLAVIEALREAQYRGPIVLISGGIQDWELTTYRNCNISGFLRKPFELSALISLLLKLTAVARH